MLIVAYMNAESLRRTVDTGRTWFWSRSRPECWCKGETSGDRQYVREVRVDCDGDALVVLVDQHGDGACHTKEWSLLLPHRGPGTGRAAPGGRPGARPGGRVTGPGSPAPARSSCDRDPRSSPSWPPTTPSCRCGRELVADTLTPVAAFHNAVGVGPGVPARVGRGRRALGPLLVRGPRPAGHGGGPRPPGVGHRPPGRARPAAAGGVLAALEELLAAFRSPVLAELPPLHAGVVGYLGYDVVREVEHLPDVPPDDLGFPDAGLMVIGQLAAFDHWRQRVVLVDNVVVDPAWSPAETDGRLRRGRPTALAELAADCHRSVPGGPIPAPGRGTPPAERTRTMDSQAYMDAVAAAKEHIVAGDIFQVVLSQRFDLELGTDPFDVYRALRLLEPQPLPLLPPARRGDGGRVVPRAHGPPARRPGHLPAHRRLAARGAPPRSRTGCWPASWWRTPRSWPSTSCWSTWPATTWGGWSSSGPRRSTS